MALQFQGPLTRLADVSGLDEHSNLPLPTILLSGFHTINYWQPSLSGCRRKDL